MDLDEFRETFLNTADVRAASDQTFRHSAFVEYSAEQLTEAGEISDVEIAYYRGSGSRNRLSGVDAYAFDDADSSVRLLIADATFSETAGSLTLTDVNAMISRVTTFVEDAISGRSLSEIEPSLAAWDLANSIHRRHDEIARFRTYIVSDRVLNVRKADWAEAAVDKIPVEVHIWDIARFHRLAQSVAGRDELVIDFAERLGNGLPCLRATDGGGEYDAYVLAVPGAVLADIYDQYGSRLLEGNIRAFLTTRPAVNKGIRNTAMNEPWMFFAYNNGIAATATEIDLDADGCGQRIVRVRDLQIVNGGQTTASLATARRAEKADLSRVYVPMKLSVVTPERSADMVPNIARFANSQNKVSEADFFSNHEFHRRLEEFSRRIWAPAKAGSQHETHWYYERARGQYLNDQAPLTPAKRRQFVEANPRDQVITKTDLGKSEMAWRGQPHVVSLGAQKNFLRFAEVISAEWTRDDTEFHEGFFKDAVARVLIFRSLEKLVSAQPWYQGGYRAQVVAYSLAKLAYLIDHETRGMTLDLDTIWRRQALSKELSGQLTLIAKAMHDVLTSPPPNVQNVTEWAKRAQCWEKAQAERVELLGELRPLLVSKNELRATVAAEKKQQKQDSGINAQIRVLDLGQPYWGRLRQWAGGRGLLVADEDTLLRLASGAGNGFPDERQSARLLGLKDRMEAEGFPRPELVS